MGPMRVDRDHNLSEMRHLLQRMDRLAVSTRDNEQMTPMYNDLMGLKMQMLGLVDKISTTQPIPHLATTLTGNPLDYTGHLYSAT